MWKSSIDLTKPSRKKFPGEKGVHTRETTGMITASDYLSDKIIYGIQPPAVVNWPEIILVTPLLTRYQKRTKLSWTNQGYTHNITP